MNTKNANIRFDMDNELHRKAWQLLQDRDKNLYPSYSQAIVCALNELLAKGTEDQDRFMADIDEAVEKSR